MGASLLALAKSIYSMHNQYPLLAFKVCLHSHLSLFNYSFGSFVFSCAVPQFADSDISFKTNIA